MKVNNRVRPEVFTGECDYETRTVTIRPSNMGEPYRDGVDFDFQSGNDYVSVFLEECEVRRVRNFLNEYTNRDIAVAKQFGHWMGTEIGIRCLIDGRYSEEFTQEEALQKAFEAGAKTRG